MERAVSPVIICFRSPHPDWRGLKPSAAAAAADGIHAHPNPTGVAGILLLLLMLLRMLTPS
jgi:hypothetical protein